MDIIFLDEVNYIDTSNASLAKAEGHVKKLRKLIKDITSADPKKIDSKIKKSDKKLTKVITDISKIFKDVFNLRMSNIHFRNGIGTPAYVMFTTIFIEGCVEEVVKGKYLSLKSVKENNFYLTLCTDFLNDKRFSDKDVLAVMLHEAGHLMYYNDTMRLIESLTKTYIKTVMRNPIVYNNRFFNSISLIFLRILMYLIPLKLWTSTDRYLKIEKNADSLASKVGYGPNLIHVFKLMKSDHKQVFQCHF